MNHFSFRPFKHICIACILLSAQSQLFAQSSPAKGAENTAPSKSDSKAGAKSAATVGAPIQKMKKQVFVLPLDGMVGIGLRHDEMEQVEKIADGYGPGQVIILRINSNGGLVTEGDLIAATLTRIKNKHRLVAWIEKAISGGAFTGLYCE